MASRVNLKMTGDDFKGIKNLKENLAKLKALQAKVGVFGGQTPEGISLPDLAFWHEYGTYNSPARSFIRTPILTRKFKVVGDKEFMKAYVIDALKSGYVHMPLDYMAKNAEALIQEAFATHGWGKWTPNAPITIHGGIMRNKKSGKIFRVKGKKSDAPLIDKGYLRQSISSIVGKKGD